MREMILCKLGEVVLKGLNRRSFEDKLIGNLRRRTAKCGNFRIYSKQSTIYVEPVNDESDLTAAFRLARACVRPMMKQRFGRIISITSVVGAMGNPGQVNYAAAKAGLMGMTKALAREIGSRGITVNCVAPGFIDTDMTRVLSDEQKDHLQAQIPLGRLGSVDDIAQSCLFLASDAGAYITGVTLHVNGGMYMG